MFVILLMHHLPYYDGGSIVVEVHTAANTSGVDQVIKGSLQARSWQSERRNNIQSDSWSYDVWTNGSTTYRTSYEVLIDHNGHATVRKVHG